MSASNQAPSLATLMDKPAESGTGIAPGNYPGRLLRFTEPRLMKDNFDKDGGQKPVFEAEIAVRLADGKIDSANLLINLPESFISGGEIPTKSNLHALLLALAGGDAALATAGKLTKGVKLSSFIGRTGNVIVEQNAKGFANVKSVTGPMDGVKYPTPEECKAFAASASVPF